MLRTSATALLLLTLGACADTTPTAPPAEAPPATPPAAPAGTAAAGTAAAGTAAAETTAAPPPAAAPDDRITIQPVDLATIPEGAAGDQIRRGRALVMDTHRLMPDKVGNGLNCTNCHLDAGTHPKAAPFVGVTTRYPRYRKRSGKVDSLAERVNGCMERSMAGQPLDAESDEMKAILAWMDFVSAGIEDGTKVADTGMPRIQPPAAPDAARGEALYAQKCAACHQPDGSGMYDGDDKTLFPPLWGDRSYNIGAGMARLHTAAAFVKWNMPLGQGGTLTDQEAYDIAAFFTVQPRQDLAKKSGDWPKGDKPDDARY